MNNRYAILLTAAGVFTAAATALEAADIQTGRDGVPIAREEDSYGGVTIGYLACDIGEGAGYFVGSAKELDCTFHSSFRDDQPDRYKGFVKRLGIDFGYTSHGRLVWAVFAPTAGYHRGSLGGTYVGAAAEATLGAGIGTNVLLGGTEGSIHLQTISVQGQIGINIAAAGATVTLKAAD